MRLRKHKGAKIQEMLYDDRTLSQNIVGRKDTVQLALERIPLAEHFTKNHLCFWLQRYRPDKGKKWNGKLFRRKEFVIDKRSKLRGLKLLIAGLLRKGDSAKYPAQRSDDDIVRNLSVAKGFSSSPMNNANISRLQWVHRNVLTHQIGIDADRYFYKLDDVDADTQTETHTTEASTQTETESANPESAENAESATKAEQIETETEAEAKSDEGTLAHTASATATRSCWRRCKTRWWRRTRRPNP